MKNILLPTDFSENAWNATLYAINLYEEESCRFFLMNSYDVNGYFEGSVMDPVPAKEELVKHKAISEERLHRLCEILKERFLNSRHKFICVALNKTLIDSINNELNQHEFELILIGTQGTTGSYEVIFGSNTIQILNEIKNCPILAVPSNVSFEVINEIVLATSYKIEHSKEDLKYLIQLAKQNNAAIRILHIEEPGGLSIAQKHNKYHLESCLKEIPHSAHSLAHVSIPIGIYCFTESRGSDMIVFINKKHNFLEKLLFNPLYKDLGNYSRIPLLVLHRSKK
ncbi:MAG: universal stress protein [Gillisia sp.]